MTLEQKRIIIREQKREIGKGRRSHNLKKMRGAGEMT